MEDLQVFHFSVSQMNRIGVLESRDLYKMCFSTGNIPLICNIDNCPAIDEHTITVTPFCGESDICPSDGNSQVIHVSIPSHVHDVSDQ